jgi:hypothetical protein
MILVERMTAYLWSVSHLVGAAIMCFGWRRYRQRFFMWMAIGWLFQSGGGIVLEQFHADWQNLVKSTIRAGATAAGFAAFYCSIVLVRKHPFATVVRVDGDLVTLRVGMENRVVRAEASAASMTEDDCPTLRPPPMN